MSRQAAYQERERNPAFAQAWDDALAEAIEAAEGEAYRRAVDGTLKPVYQGGKKVGTIREFSDTLITFMLKSHKPKIYRETFKVETWQDDVLRALPSLTHEQRAALYADLVRTGFESDAIALFAKAGIAVAVNEDAHAG